MTKSEAEVSRCGYCNCDASPPCRRAEDTLKCYNYQKFQKLVSGMNSSMKPKNQRVKKTMTQQKSNAAQLAELATRTGRHTISVIDTLAQRGAFRGEEMQAIGGMRNDCAQLIQLAETVTNEVEDTDNESADSK